MKLDLNKLKFIFAVLLFLGVEPLISKTYSDGFCKSQRSIENADQSQNGSFLNHDGKELPW